MNVGELSNIHVFANGAEYIQRLYSPIRSNEGIEYVLDIMSYHFSEIDRIEVYLSVDIDFENIWLINESGEKIKVEKS